MNKQIYMLYSCNSWKDKNSIRLIMASTSKNKIIKQIKEEVLNDNMELYDFSKSELKDYKETDIYRINNELVYGYIEVVDDGEVQ